ncbi:DNA replication and repair protein RecF [termite gut metagenome]|uniref:DNA replication and repair protein RecF n=1 Tax=termite gut metagenome TaxID=433724 RepID=A0A5J4SC25_9ZZZZ
MIESISIKNFKSILDLKLPLGRFNVLIGENGCGKSNILESISYGSAALSDKLDNEYLSLRGIRVTDARFMTSAFDEQSNDTINITFNDGKEAFKCSINAKTNTPFILSPPDDKNKNKYDILITVGSKGGQIDIGSRDTMGIIGENKQDIKGQVTQLGKYDKFNTNKDIESFVFYCPEESSLRTFRDEYQLLPLGRKGEGLFRYLKTLAQTDKGKQTLEEIKENLVLLDWFDDIKIPTDSLSNDYTISIKDRYIHETISFFDQRSTNEGFLYLLFYLTLFISEETPCFFAIDNIESSFNPKLCRRLIEILIKLAQEHNKQVIITTHNPSVLDGLNIDNDDERLFVIRRNLDGHTKVDRVQYKNEKKLSIPLSEAWVKGYLGGLPENF